MVMCGRGNLASSSCRIQRDKLAPGHSYNKLLICSGGLATGRVRPGGGRAARIQMKWQPTRLPLQKCHATMGNRGAAEKGWRYRRPAQMNPWGAAPGSR